MFCLNLQSKILGVNSTIFFRTYTSRPFSKIVNLVLDTCAFAGFEVFFIASGMYTRTGINAVSQSRAEGRLFTDLQWPESHETVSIYIYYSCVY